MSKDTNIHFVLKDDLSLGFSALLKKHIEQKQILNSSFAPDMLNECSRRIIYKVNGYYKDIDYLERKSQIANTNKWDSIFKSCVGIMGIDSHICVANAKYQIAGYLEFLLEISGIVIATNVRNVTEETFNKIKTKGALKKDVMEIMVYLWLMELKDGLILYENMRGHDLLSFHIKYHVPIVNSIKEKCNQLIKFQRANEIPARSYKSSSEKECAGCEFLEKCWR